MLLPLFRSSVFLAATAALVMSALSSQAGTAGVWRDAATAISTKSNDLWLLDHANLVDQQGHRFHSTEVEDSLVLVNFIFTHCSTSCPIQTGQLVEVMHSLPQDVRKKVSIISVSVDPANDTPSALKSYARHQGADMKNWFFLTGSPSEIGQLTSTLGVFAVVATAPNAGRHTTDIRLFDRQGRFRQRYSGVPVDKQRLSTEMQAMMSAAPLKSY